MHSPSQRFRFEQFYKHLEETGFHYQNLSFLSVSDYIALYDASSFEKIIITMKGFLRRVQHLTKIRSYKYVLIHREVTPVGPPIFEWVIAKVFRKRIIYDFDDAIWLNDPKEVGTLKAWLKAKWKIEFIIKWSHKISAGNEYLAEYAKKYNPNVTVVPTVVDTEEYHNPSLHVNSGNKIPVVGWTGSHTTLQYLDPLILILRELAEEINFEFLVIANTSPDFELQNLRFIPWKKQTEIEDLMKMDIGIMPLTDDEWSRGKCGFKLIQYLALEKPALASPVGINDKIVIDGENGFICSTKEEWKSKLKILLEDPVLRNSMGKKGRSHIIDTYSVRANSDKFLSLFE